MKKPLTKEEFLERKNSEIHRELLSVFSAKAELDKMRNYLNRLERENQFQFCKINRPTQKENHTNYWAVQLFYGVFEMLKSGELVFKDKDAILLLHRVYDQATLDGKVTEDIYNDISKILAQ